MSAALRAHLFFSIRYDLHVWQILQPIKRMQPRT
jgi:hypothetical protein